jgi:DNA replication protein DnaC
MNRALIQHHFTLSFLKDHMNVMYLGGVGLGKTPLAIALG